MSSMATTGKQTTPRLRREASLDEVIDAVNELAAEWPSAGRLSPSKPLDAPDPSAVITYSEEEYDALMKRLEAPPAPNERLRRTMLGPGG
jgi:hypothetical protein